jgi:hypothetical protein
MFFFRTVGQWITQFITGLFRCLQGGQESDAGCQISAVRVMIEFKVMDFGKWEKGMKD